MDERPQRRRDVVGALDGRRVAAALDGDVIRARDGLDELQLCRDRHQGVCVPGGDQSLMVHAIADATVIPSIQLATSHLAGEAQASAQGLLNASGLVIAACVALGSGAIYQAFGPFWLFAGWAIVMACSTSAAVLVGKEELTREARMRAEPSR